LRNPTPYDALNRLEAASEVNGAAETWRQTYIYDRFGNRRLNEQHTTKLKAAGLTVYSVDPSTRSTMNPAVSASTNRISEAGYRFDASGDMLCDPTHPCGPAPSLTPYFDYDAEGRITKAAGGAQAGGSDYAYDGDGRRVKKVSGAVMTVFVYDAAGRLVAEYSNQSGDDGVSYLTQDTLGSTRVVTDKDGNAKSRHDYLPFGEEIDGLQAPNSGRENFTSYNHGNVRRKFTGYERDGETQLDYAQARYYSPAIARFTSFDPLLSSAKPAEPQSWNRYTYTVNNPLVYTDPSGLIWGYQDYKVDGKNWRVFGWFSTSAAMEFLGYFKYEGNYYVFGDGRAIALSSETKNYLWLDKSQFSAEMWKSLEKTQFEGGYFSDDQLKALKQATADSYAKTPDFQRDKSIALTVATAGSTALTFGTRALLARAFVTPHNSAYFWLPGARQAAISEAAANNGVTILDTQGGRAMSALEPRMPAWLANRMWGYGSELYASQISGNAHLVNAGSASARGFFFTREAGALYRNPNFQTVIEHRPPFRF
jgi:RHS repeat-associated protein